jgi:hypothetical protein
VKRRTPNYNMFAPLIWAPIMPMIRLGLRGRVPQHQIDKVFGAAGAIKKCPLLC